MRLSQKLKKNKENKVGFTFALWLLQPGGGKTTFLRQICIHQDACYYNIDRKCGQRQTLSKNSGNSCLGNWQTLYQLLVSALPSPEILFLIWVTPLHNAPGDIDSTPASANHLHPDRHLALQWCIWTFLLLRMNFWYSLRKEPHVSTIGILDHRWGDRNGSHKAHLSSKS